MPVDLSQPMILVGAMTAAVLALMVAAVVVGATGRTRRRRVAARRERLATQIRPLISDALDAPEAETAAALDEAVRALSPAAGETLDDLVVALVPKLRGTERELLVRLLRVRGTIDRVAFDIRSPWPRRRLSAAEFLGAVDDGTNAGGLIVLLDDRDEAVRLAAVRALGRIGAAQAVPALFGRLDRPNPGRRLPVHAVTMAILRCGTDASPHLFRALERGALPSRLAAAQLLGWLGELSGAGALRHALAHDALDVRVAAAESLGRLGVPDTAADLITVLHPRHPVVLRLAAATALGRIGDPGSTPALTGVVAEDRDARVALAAARAMARLGMPGIWALEDLAVHSPVAREVLEVHRASQLDVTDEMDRDMTRMPTSRDASGMTTPQSSMKP